MRPQSDLRSLLQATLTRHFLERKAGCYHLYTADQIRVAVEDTNVVCPWNDVPMITPQVPMMQQGGGGMFIGMQQQAPNPLAQMMQQFFPQPLVQMPQQAPNPLAQMMQQQAPQQIPQLLAQMMQQQAPQEEPSDESSDDGELSYQERRAVDAEEFCEDFKKFPRVQAAHGIWRQGWEKALSDVRCLAYFQTYAFPVVKALEAHPGQLFVAGGCFSEMLTTGVPSAESDFDLFVCAENAEEGEKVLASAAKILEDEMKLRCMAGGGVTVQTTTQATTFLAWQTGLYFTLKIQIIRRLYPVGRHDMIPGCFDLWPSQFIWSPSTGLQCTLPGLVSLIIRGFPIDLARRSPAMLKRIDKYVERKGFTCYLMGVNPEYPQSEFGWQHPTNNKIGEKFTNDGGENTYRTYNSFGIGAEYDFPNEEAKEEEDEYQAFIKDNPTVWDNLRCALAEKPHIVLELKSYADFCTERVNISSSILGEYVSLSQVGTMNRKTLRKFFKDEDIKKEFVVAYFGEEDEDKASDLWAKNIESLVAHFVPLFCGATHPSKYWKVDNPGAQGFGQNCPRPVQPREYYGEYYYPTICGIPPKEVLIVRRLCKINKCPLDVERLLCHYLLAMHASDVYRMLNL